MTTRQPIRLTRRGELAKRWLEVSGVIVFLIALPTFLAMLDIRP